MPKHPKSSNNTITKFGSDREWVETELQTLRLGDKRLDNRVKKILGDFGSQPGASIPRASGNWGATKAVYRCLDHKDVKAKAIMEAHRESSLERARPLNVVLAAQDTTSLNFSTHPHTKGLGPISNNRDKTIGLFLHSTLMMREDGQAIGLLDTQLSARDGARYKTRPSGERNRLAVEQKESYRWLSSVEATHRAAQAVAQTVFINIADREGDIYELFRLHQQLRLGQTPANASKASVEAAGRVELLIRCQHNRALECEQERLFEHLVEQPVAGNHQFMAPRQPGQKARLVTLGMRFAKVTLAVPINQAKYHGRSEPIVLWAILAQEENPPPGQPPVCWRLLSTIPVHDRQTAILQVFRYSQRWQIEIFHKTLKSGCKAEDRQLENVDRLERCLALDIIVAWRVLAMSKAGRGIDAGGPVSQWMADYEWKALWCYIHKRTDAPDTPPSTHQAVRWVAQLGGFLARKSDGHPGPMTVWRGLQRLNDFASAYLLFITTSKDVGNA